MLGVAFVTVASWVIYSPIDKSGSPNVGTWYEPLARQDTRPWHGPTSWHLDTVAIRWSQPPDPQSDEALGNGITFALHKDFCSRMLGLFPEANILGDFFLSCQDLRNTVKRAMDTWAINHKGINFKDVTESCRDVELKDADSCAAAEIFIVPNDLESRQAGDLAAWVEYVPAFPGHHRPDALHNSWLPAAHEREHPQSAWRAGAPQNSNDSARTARRLRLLLVL